MHLKDQEHLNFVAKNCRNAIYSKKSQTPLPVKEMFLTLT